ncbi:MAG: GHKL domain-containing protein [Bacteroidales bacterium]|nr:GHKL domain-containing protein [Bacteroidales bacterium]
MNSNNRQDLPSFWRTSRFFWLALTFAALALLFQNIHKRTKNEIIDHQRIEHLVQERLIELNTQISDLVQSLNTEQITDFLSDTDNPFFVYDGDSLIFWSDNSIALPGSWGIKDFHNGLLEFPNLSGLCVVSTIDSLTVAGVIPLQYHFPIENGFLSNKFLIGGSRSSSYVVVPASNVSEIIIHDLTDNPLFGLHRSNVDNDFSFFWFLAIGLYGMSLLFVLCFLLDLFQLGYSLWHSNWWLLFLAADLGLLRWLLSNFKVPDLIYNLSWFQSFNNPVKFFESQGEALISLVFLLFFSLAINKWFRLYPERVNESTKSDNPRLVDSFTSLGWLLVFVAWFGLNRFWIFLLKQCEDVIEIHNVLSITFHSFMDIILMAITASAFVLILYRISKQAMVMYPIRRFVLVPVIMGVAFYVVTQNAGLGLELASLIVLLSLILICGISLYRKEAGLNQFGMVLIQLIFAIFMIFALNQTNKVKKEAIQIALISNLSNEHDPVAERLLLKMDSEICSDSTLVEMIRNPRTPEEEVRTYLLDNRFGQYWDQYKISVNICDSVNMLIFSTERLTVGCLDHWNSIKERDGELIGDSHFYYINNFDGIVWYLGIFPVFTADSAYVYHLTVSAELELMPEGLGYPDVLIAGENRRDSLWDEYSFAKYQDCHLVSRSGDYTYASSCESYPSSSDSIVRFEDGRFDHWISELDKSSKIIISKPRTSVLEHLFAFSYLFVSFYIIWLIISLFLFLPTKINAGNLDLKSKIQFSMISILIISFLLIGGGMSYFIINQYDQTNQNTISEKIQSVSIEMKHKLDFEEELTADWTNGSYPNLQSLLVKFSYVFNTDINIYNPQGSLLASSRPEVFQHKLTGTHMDSYAYYEMAAQKQMELVQRENIGDLGFWSAYVPFYNFEGKLLAYLNLPYFSKQSEIRKEVSTFMVAMLNGYFLLIFLTVVFAVLLGNQLTRPLRLLQERFSGMKLGGQNTQIEYHRKDEIGGLVAAYNQMVQQLEASAEMLARSERESAWREMAKQIAHEIKNPLTPMKLSVQHLKRSWDDRVDNWDDYLERVTKTLVEQIDALSVIANEFSQFAKMPKAKREELDFVAKVENSIALFMESGSSNIFLEVKDAGPLIVFLDKEQLLQVFNNLINNAIQSVPQGRKPEVRVCISKVESNVLLSIEDNGTGIPKELQAKLFQPSFTTKTSGMGLGLAISKNIIENSEGKIWFETRSGGTTFFVEFPLVKRLSE